MIAIPIICLTIIWAAFIYGGMSDDYGTGIVEKVFCAAAHAAAATLGLGCFGSLVYASALILKAAVS